MSTGFRYASFFFEINQVVDFTPGRVFKLLLLPAGFFCLKLPFFLKTVSLFHPNAKYRTKLYKTQNAAI